MKTNKENKKEEKKTIKSKEIENNRNIIKGNYKIKEGRERNLELVWKKAYKFIYSRNNERKHTQRGGRKAAITMEEK